MHHYAKAGGGLYRVGKVRFITMAILGKPIQGVLVVRARPRLVAGVPGDPRSWRAARRSTTPFRPPARLGGLLRCIGGGTGLRAFRWGEAHSTRESIHIAPAPLPTCRTRTRPCAPDTEGEEKFISPHNLPVSAAG